MDTGALPKLLLPTICRAMDAPGNRYAALWGRQAVCPGRGNIMSPDLCLLTSGICLLIDPGFVSQNNLDMGIGIAGQPFDA